MSFSEEVRAELAAIEPRKPCCRLAEVSALARHAGTLHLRGAGSVTLHLDLASHAVARRSFALLRTFGLTPEIRSYRRRSFGMETRFQLHLGDDPRALQTLNEAGVLDAHLGPRGEPPRHVVARRCCRAAYLRGAVLAAGSVSGPRAVHLEIRAADTDAARSIAALAAEEGVVLAVVDRTRHAAAYARGTDTVAELLGLVGAHAAALAIEEASVVSEARSHANRLANADHANLVRASRAAQQELRAIRKLERSGALESVEPALREVADLRLRHPALSLRELAKRCRPPATKAAVHRRLKRLERLALD